MDLTALIVVALIFVSAIAYPPLCVTLAIAVLDIAVWRFGPFARYIGLVEVAIYVAGCWCWYGLYRDHPQGQDRRRILAVTGVVLVLPAVCGLSALANGLAFRAAVRAAFACNSAALVVAIRYFKRTSARWLFVGLIAGQTVLANGLLINPGGPLHVFASPVLGPEGSVSQETERNEAEELLAPGEILRGSFAKRYAQFYSPINFSFAAAVCTTIGMSLSFLRRRAYKLGGLGLLCLGLFTSLQCFQRGILLGLAVGILYVAWRSKSVALQRGVSAALIVLASIGLLLGASGAAELPIVEKLINMFDPQEEEYRIQALATVPEYFLASPIWGAGSYQLGESRAGLLPHQYILWILMVHGLLACLLIGYLTWVGLAPLTAMRLKWSSLDRWPNANAFSVSKAELVFCSIGAFVVLFTCMTNAIAADVPQWIIWGAAAYPGLITNVSKHSIQKGSVPGRRAGRSTVARSRRGGPRRPGLEKS
jgi:hypothetical protein